ncbi:MAG: c-type cytochrome [Nitrospiraceae bacterium]
MIRLFSAIRSVAMLLSCSGERARVTVEEPQGSQQTGSAPIEFAPPSPETIPGSQLGEQIRLGYEIVVNTQDYAGPYVGNRLNCTNCHLDGGLNPNAASFVGLTAIYPEYRARNAKVNTLADRVNECFERSLNGRALPPDSSKLQAVVAYITWLSRGVPSGATITWRGLQRIQSRRPIDPGNGGKVFTSKCVFCHGSDGLGTMAAPPVWGPQSYTIGSGMARVSVAAAFIKSNMPRSWGWSLSDEDAYDVASYINAQPRPDFPGKANDWPKGGKPADSPY